MLTKRDSLIALVSVCATLSIMAFAQTDKQVMGSTIFDWNSIQVKPTKVGERRDFVQRPTATLDELEIHVTTLNPGESPHAPHKHPDEELVIVKEGTIESMAGDQTKVVGPGSIVFQASNQMHGTKNVGKVPATYFIVRWKSPGFFKEHPPKQ
ncbi:MAG TPA: cupin domain-containing protein [Blastocatellia bacterium]|nr:cupin domain-containing protein [Blastocatellia bacterium]